MAKKAKSGKVTRAITVDVGLDRRMRKVTEVNWSAVASAAFERELQLQKWRVDMNNTIERLRASKEEDMSEKYQDGQVDGRSWAAEYAEYNELKRLAKLMNAGHDTAVILSTSETDAYLAAERLAFAITGDDSSRSVSEEFWESAIGEESIIHLDSDDYVRGFAEGAFAVWNAVSQHL